MSKDSKDTAHKQHFELSPANKRRLNSFLEWYNSAPSRVTTRWKIGDVVNAALDRWLSRRMDTAPKQEGDPNGKKAR